MTNRMRILHLHMRYFCLKILDETPCYVRLIDGIRERLIIILILYLTQLAPSDSFPLTLFSVDSGQITII